MNMPTESELEHYRKTRLEYYAERFNHADLCEATDYLVGDERGRLLSESLVAAIQQYLTGMERGPHIGQKVEECVKHYVDKMIEDDVEKYIDDYPNQEDAA